MKGGREATPLDAVEWAVECVRRGAGEVLLTSIDRDGARTGYDLALTRAVADVVHVPVVASGGAGTAAHVCEVLADAGADAALLAGILHDEVTTVTRGEGGDARGAHSGEGGMSVQRPAHTHRADAALVLDDRIAPAAELARLTGTVALRYYRSRLTVETKADGSPVTEADRAAETAARAWVRSRFPE